MREFLTKNDVYEIKIVEYYEAYNEYHNRVVEEKRTMEIAYPKQIPFDNFIAAKEGYTDLVEWSLTSVFEREMVEKLLQL
jgi:regulatory protein YycH of two-component signal transduction system YycFG